MQKFALAALLTFAAVTGVHAQSLKTIKNANNQVVTGIGVHDLEYAEYDKYHQVPGYLDTEMGSQPAVSFSIGQQADLLGQKNVYWKLDYIAAKGTTAYDGYLQDSNGNIVSPYKNTTDSGVDHFTLKLGKAFAVNSHAQVTPFGALTSRAWRRAMQGPYGYTEIYDFKALEVGVLGQYAFTPKLVGSASLSTGSTYNATMYTNIIGQGNYKLGSSPITNINLNLDYVLNRSTHLNIGYFQSDFKFGESPVVGNSFEPESFSKVKGFTVGVGFHF